MADIHIVRTHSMPLQQARDAASNLAGKLEQKFDLETQWQEDTLHFQRPGVTGTLALGEGEVTIDVRLGLLLSAFRGAMEEQISEQLDRVFDPAQAAAPASQAPKKRA